MITLFHAIDTSNFMTIQNLQAMQGYLPSASFASLLSGNADPQSFYQMANANKEKEDFFENVRINEYPNATSRLGALFCFVQHSDAEYANENWWNNERLIVEAIPANVTSITTYDSRHLDTNQENWLNAARSYFASEETATPLLEVVICGRIFIPSWTEIVQEYHVTIEM